MLSIGSVCLLGRVGSLPETALPGKAGGDPWDRMTRERSNEHLDIFSLVAVLGGAEPWGEPT